MIWSLFWFKFNVICWLKYSFFSWLSECMFIFMGHALYSFNLVYTVCVSHIDSGHSIIEVVEAGDYPLKWEWSLLMLSMISTSVLMSTPCYETSKYGDVQYYELIMWIFCWRWLWVLTCFDFRLASFYASVLL